MHVRTFNAGLNIFITGLTTMSDLDMNFSDSIYTIESAVRKFGFPMVVKSDNACSSKKRRDEQAEYFENRLKLPYGSITILERKVTLQFAHVTVMEFRDPDKVQEDKGIDFVESHSEYEDDDYLLPLTFEGKCEIVHPPGKRKRYVSVAQVGKVNGYSFRESNCTVLKLFFFFFIFIYSFI